MKHILIFLSVLFLTASCNDTKMTQTKREGEPNIYGTLGDDKEMNEAIVEAKTTLGEFGNAFQSNKLDTGTFALKVRFPTETGAEHIWATGIQIINGNYYGIIDNLPNTATQVKLGERIKLNKEDITDWMYADSGILRGGYTIKLIRSRMNEQEKKQFDASFPFKIAD